MGELEDERLVAKSAKDAKIAKKLIYPEPSSSLDALAYDVIGAAIEVHSCLGPGFQETSYEAALSVELSLRGIPFERQVSVPLRYKGHDIGQCRIDLLVCRQLVVELKAVEALHEAHHAQVVAYLQALRLPLGLLINFNVVRLKFGIKRIVASQHTKKDLGDLGVLGALGDKSVTGSLPTLP